MPGPPLSKTFTYNGTPELSSQSDPYNTLDRVMVQTQRFFISKDTGTHSKTATRNKIVRNSGEGVGVGSSEIRTVDQQEE